MSSNEHLKKAYIKILTFITNTFYRTNENNEISIKLNSSGDTTINYWDGNQIVLNSLLMESFAELNLPRFTVYYHELGHHLYSTGALHLINTWECIRQGPLAWYEAYHHLFNWLEDFYIEAKLLIEHPYLTDVLSCTKKLEPEYDIKNIKYAFNYWYIYNNATPALNTTDQTTFKSYIKKLLTLRSSTLRFGRGHLTTISIMHTVETKFVLLLIEFYDWCVQKKIFPERRSEPLPALINPNLHLVPTNYGVSQPINKSQIDSIGSKQNNIAQKDDANLNSNSIQGSRSDHTKIVGKCDGTYTQQTPIKQSTDLFKEELVQENRLIEKELLDLTQQLQVNEVTFDGLFSTRYKDSSIIQPKVTVSNFFNPKRLIDQTLFLDRAHTYTNVAIYRDISGSVSEVQHTYMHVICEQLYKEIPVDISYYLYASGDISIIKVPYVPWKDLNTVPVQYQNDPLYKQLGRLTNSDAIADVITQQFSEKWLNIIITDGDLTALLERENIYDLLKNVFVISIVQKAPENLKGITIKSPLDFPKIKPALSQVNLS